MDDETRTRMAALNITARFEGRSYRTYRHNDPGIISYGRFNFTLDSDALAQLVQCYTAQSKTPVAVDLRAYQIRLDAADETLNSDELLHGLLVRAASDPIMQQCQDDEATTRFWDPIQRIAVLPRSLQCPLSWALLFDIGICYGIGDGLLRIAEAEFGVPPRAHIADSDLSEERLITRTAELYKQAIDRQASAESRPGIRERGEFWLNLIAVNDWTLQGDAAGNITVKGQPVQVRAPRRSLATDHLDPAVFYIIPTADQVRVRAQPEDGETVAMLSPGDLAEVLDPYEEAADKIGTPGQWVHLRTTDGTEGYGAAWFYRIYQKPGAVGFGDEDGLYVVAEIDSVRIRAWPVDGRPVASVSRGEVVQVMEPYAEAITKVGGQSEWLHVRTRHGVAGYTAAWFYRVLETPDAPAEPPPVQSLPSAPQAEPEPVPAAAASAPRVEVESTPPGPRSPAPVEAISRKLYITPTDNRIRIRAEPVDGEPLTVILLGQIIEVLTPYAEAIQCIGVEGEWLHVCTADGVEGYTAAWFYTVFDHAQMPDLDSLPLYVTPSDDLVRVRAQPGDGDPIDLVSRGDILTVLENQDEASSKLASEDQWLRIRTPNQVEGYVASQFLSAVEQPLPDWQLDANITGVNIDLYHPLGQPDPDDLGQMGWLRLPYNVSLNPDLPEGHPARYGNTDLDAAYQRYQPLIAHYAQAGFKILLTLTHQTYGEGAGYNWHRMNSDQWHDLGDQFAIMAGHIAAQYKGLVSAYQIWNEMDAPSEAHTAVPMPAADYAYLLFKSIQAIRAVDHTALVITGGHSGGPSSGVLYAMYTLNTMPRHVRPDGIAFHAFGRGDARSDAKFRSKGHIDDAVNAFAGIMPGYPVWITEWGVLDQPQETPEAVARYASEFIQRLKQTHSHKVAVAIWYAWAQGMGNGYGMVNERGKLRFDLAERFITL